MSTSNIQSQLRLSHYSSVAISVLLNIGLFVMLLVFLKFSEPQPEINQAIKVIEADETPEEIQEIEEIIPPEEVETTDQIEPTSMDMSEMVSEQLDTSVPQEEQAIASPIVSPVIMQGLAQAMGGVNLSGLAGGTKRATRFMGQSAEGNRFAFVIDYSKSMKPPQLKVMKHELTTALAAIGQDGLATLLFFAGPVWRPDKDGGSQDAGTGAHARWKKRGNKGWQLLDGAESPNPQWLVPDQKNMAALERMIHKTPPTLGTDWYPPFNEILSMRPRPDVIFFMTDGRANPNRALELVRSLPKGQVVINTVALGINEEDAAPLKEIAELTGGNFRRYSYNETKKQAESLPPPPSSFSDAELSYLTPAEVRNRQSRGSGPRRPPPEEVDVVSFEIN